MFEKLKKIPKYFWILLAIVLVGIFLRAYHFGAWAEFDSDQVRDAVLDGQVIAGHAAWPLLGPTMRGSNNAAGKLFHVGPIYYWFQIVSGKLFGNYPDKLAYPDLLFGISAVPLFYYFLKRYFAAGLSLGLTALLAVSFYAIQYSRFAWNPNSIPFFTLLFLLSFYELLAKRERVAWGWIVAAGIALGVGVQLHVVTLLLFGATAFFVFVYLLATSPKVWGKVAMVILLALIINAGQLTSELKTGFANSKTLIYSSLHLSASSGKKEGLLGELGTDADCQTEANTYMLSAVGSNSCAFAYASIFNNTLKEIEGLKVKSHHSKKPNDPTVGADLFLGLFLSLFGYGLLFYRAWKETERERRIFLRLVVLYVGLAFLIMASVIGPQYAEFRYEIQVFFVPFLFAGLLVELLRKKAPGYAGLIAAAGMVFLAATNIWSLSTVAGQLLKGDRSNLHFAILGEMETMVKYIEVASGGAKNIYLVGDAPYVSHFVPPFDYLAGRDGVKFTRVSDDKIRVPAGRPIFYITDSVRTGTNQIGGYKIENYKVFGQVVIYKLQGD